MWEQIQENPVVFILLAVGLVLFLALYIAGRKIGGNAKSSDRARVIQCGFTPSPMGFLPGMLTRMSDGMAAPVGILKITVGTPPFMDMPQAVDIKLFIVDEHKRVFEASKNMSVRQDGIIGIIDVPFPIRPYEKEFICRAWVAAAYFKSGDTWINNNASAYEAKNKKFIARKLSKIK